MRSLKTALLTAAAGGALAVGLGAGTASAFDKVNWEWTSKINERIEKKINIDVDFDPTGVVHVEDIQVHVGDVRASSVVNGVYNNQPASTGGSATVDFTVSFSDPYAGGLDPHPYSGTATLGGGLSGTGSISGQVLEGSNRVSGTATFEDIAVTVAPSPSFDAVTQLPEVKSAATAVGNNVSVESDVMVEMHNGQFVFNTDGDLRLGAAAASATGGIGSLLGNTNHLLGAAVLLGTVFGVVEPAEISAVSQVSNILNASVDSAATAVGNNKSITIDARTPGDAVLIGDMTQVSVANISAQSNVSNVTLNNYTNLGLASNTLNRPIVNSVATAVGNNLSIKVNSPAAP